MSFDWTEVVSNVKNALDAIYAKKSDYKRYVIELYSDNTFTTPAIEAKIDSTIYWLVKAYNIKGEQIPVGEFTLKCTTSDGVTSTLDTCNDSTVEMRAGTYVCSRWGYCRFSIETYATVINITGWKTIATIKSGLTVYANEHHVKIVMDGAVYGTVTAPTSFTTLHTLNIPTEYLPTMPVTTNAFQHNIVVGLRENGVYGLKSLSGSKISGVALYISLSYPRR